MAWRAFLFGAVAALFVLGCGKSSLTTRDAGADRPGNKHPIDAAVDLGRDIASDVAHDAGNDRTHAAVDAAPLQGRRAFDVAFTLTLAPPSPQSPSSPDFLTNVKATLVLDATERWLLTGVAGQGARAPIALDGGRVTVMTPLTLTVPSDGTCAGTSLNFDALELTVGDDGKLHGRGTGQESYITGDVGYSRGFTAIVDGVPDTTGPALSIPTDVPLDPLAPGRFAASEPLPAGTQARLVGADGTVVALTPQIPQNVSPAFVTAFVTAFLVPSVLPFGGSFHLELDQVVDFAGIQAATPPGPSLVTASPPPLLADGSFESAPAGPTNDGIISAGGDLPVISGTKSLYLADTTPWFGWTVTFRLAVHPGDKTVRFAYRVASPYQVTGVGFYGSVVIGSVGSKVAALSSLPLGAPTTAVTRMNGTTLTLGPVATAELALPDPSATEVVLRIATATSGCGLRPPAAGLIVDDVRVGN